MATATSAATWQTPAIAPVTSAAGKTGGVTLAAGDITFGSFTASRLGSGTPNLLPIYGVMEPGRRQP